MKKTVIQVAQELIQIKTITPQGSKALDYIQDFFSQTQPFISRQIFHEKDSACVDNLFLRIGQRGPHFCFAGHVDVVPEGHLEKWHADPFGGIIQDNFIYGRGACDMKGAIAAFMVAADQYVQTHGLNKGSISLLLTCDEEGPAINGTQKMLAWMKDHHHLPTVCLVGEPTSERHVGDTFKIGRRGSMNFMLRILGKAGHVAYPETVKNPIVKMAKVIENLSTTPLDAGGKYFAPSHLAFSSLKCANQTSNTTPEEVEVYFNIRFNDLHSPHTIAEWVHQNILPILTKDEFELSILSQSSPFYCQDQALIALIQKSIQEVNGAPPQASTSGGTSDARFIYHHCPVLECGLLNNTIHQANERAAIEDVYRLKEIYLAILKNYFQLNPLPPHS